MKKRLNQYYKVAKINNSRLYEGYITATLVILDKNVALSKFLGVVDNKAAANRMFKEVKMYYKNLLKL